MKKQPKKTSQSELFDALAKKVSELSEDDSGKLVGGFTSISALNSDFFGVTNSGRQCVNGDCSGGDNTQNCHNNHSCSGNDNSGVCINRTVCAER